ncbi:uncharacterized protein AMSG_07689 [Thecamonas trahens ATCC 50062]|uniref:TLC domain-containing protein n=1 Tax=Thecamonas trahens ATCC 50062 TaxID=461836 RepID=A0A0L0DGN6_THETB|nr:hypothetical protein AMSG_07689 [Thecamonas trahens ATCC 50062]KNC51492.1 hypothetical protein AMSG_07689 [Thecamonas trahens ATCC 50062]|eukprot:XP_013756150.1 hypothetical protein AMSG_07689 [Thecamonas trahens ATCC 50062]
MDRLIQGVVEDGDWVAPFAVAFSVGYFVSDMVVMMTNSDVWALESVIHHLVIGGGFAIGLIAGVTTPYHFLFLIEELSTVFLNARYFWRASPALHTVFSNLFALTFFLSRIIGGTCITSTVIPFLLDPATERALQPPYRYYALWTEIVLLVLSRALNLYWGYLILSKLLCPRPPRKPASKTN